jgi:hypothetical protein
MAVAAREPLGARAAPSTHFGKRILIFGDITMPTTVEKPISHVTAAEVRVALAIERSTVRKERCYGYRHRETGRQFSVRRSEYGRGKFRFFLCEMHPNGRMMELNDQGEVVRAWDEPCIKKADSRVGPNGLLATLLAMGIDVEALVFWGAGYSVDSIYHESLETCAESIAQALNENVRYISYNVDLEN